MPKEARGGARARPNYDAYKVDAIPPDITLPRNGPRLDPKFQKGLQDAMNDPGTPWVLGEFQSDNGAHNLYKRIDKGEIKLPVGDWLLETRRAWMRDEDGEIMVDSDGKQRRKSILYGVYEGPVSDDD